MFEIIVGDTNIKKNTLIVSYKSRGLLFLNDSLLNIFRNYSIQIIWFYPNPRIQSYTISTTAFATKKKTHFRHPDASPIRTIRVGNESVRITVVPLYFIKKACFLNVIFHTLTYTEDRFLD